MLFGMARGAWVSLHTSPTPSLPPENPSILAYVCGIHSLMESCPLVATVFMSLVRVGHKNSRYTTRSTHARWRIFGSRVVGLGIRYEEHLRPPTIIAFTPSYQNTLPKSFIDRVLYSLREGVAAEGCSQSELVHASRLIVFTYINLRLPNCLHGERLTRSTSEHYQCA